MQPIFSNNFAVLGVINIIAGEMHHDICQVGDENIVSDMFATFISKDRSMWLVHDTNSEELK